MDPKVRSVIRLILFIIALLLLLAVIFGFSIPGMPGGNEVRTVAIAVLFLLLSNWFFI